MAAPAYVCCISIADINLRDPASEGELREISNKRLYSISDEDMYRFATTTIVMHSVKVSSHKKLLNGVIYKFWAIPSA